MSHFLRTTRLQLISPCSDVNISSKEFVCGLKLHVTKPTRVYWLDSGFTAVFYSRGGPPQKKKTIFVQRTTDWSHVDVLTRHSLQIQRERVDYKWAFQSFKVSPTGVLERWYNMPTDTLPAEIREARLFCENKCANGTLNLSVVKANQQVSSMSFSTVMGHRCFKFAISFSCSTTGLLVLSSVESNFPKT